MTQRRMPSGQGPSRRSGIGRDGPRTPLAYHSARPDLRGVSARSARRPAAARRAAAGGAAKRTSAPRPRRFTGRAVILGAVLITLALGYTYPVRLYLSQQAEIAALEAAQEAQRRRIGELTEEAAKWKDDEYVRIQARKRFYMVYPGEVPLLVLTDSDEAAGDGGMTPDSRTQPPDPWYETLWSSIQAADDERPEE
ncbi:MAG TPA: septum formation initiator family protein [Micromonospora sp.]